MFGYFCHIPQIKNSYYIQQNFILIYDGLRLSLKQNFISLSDILEKNYCNELEKIDKKEIIPISKEAIKHSKNNNHKKIWLINDRFNKAGDNGEFFFRYLKNKNLKDIIVYFVLSKNCYDYQILKLLGNVLYFGSKKYNDAFI